MPNPLPAASAPAPTAMTGGTAIIVPPANPVYPHAAALGLIAVALAYFALGVGVGAVMKSTRHRRWLPFLIGPGVIAAIGYLVWVARSLG